MASDKTAVMEHLFLRHWDPVNKVLRQSLMSQADVKAAMEYCNNLDGLSRSTDNPANFCKDAIRKSNASKNWPAVVAANRYTAIQRTGNKSVFEFVPYAIGQTDPFPDIHTFRPGVNIYKIQSLSMLNESKMLGRRDEAWLTQTAVNLRVVETHFAIESPLKARVVDLHHLQMSLKLRRTEVDAFFMARLALPSGALTTVGITCEAKQASERVLESQIVEQVKAAFLQGHFEQIIPIAIRMVRKRGIYLAEFEAVNKSQSTTYEQPIRVAEALYELHPVVPGI